MPADGCGARSSRGRSGPPGRNHPADAANVANDVLVELAPHIVNENVDSVAFHLVPPIVEAVLKLAAGQDCAGPLGEGAYKRELLSRQNRRYTAIDDFVPGEIERQLT